jgi:16S rRNA (cytidine1402-2'-O)-methyltransferase
VGGTLYLVSTPIGNLEDITLRALRTLGEVSLIAAEDTRHTRILLAHHEIDTQLISYHDHSDRERRERILQALEKGDVALVTDAGTPGLADPGYGLVREVLERGQPVEAIPGPTAAITALVLSGLPPYPFLFLGYPPRQARERYELLEAIAGLPYTLVFFEAPHRLKETLADFLEVLGNRPAAIARELTKLHQEVRRETITQALTHYQEVEPRGEFTLVIAGGKEGPASKAQVRARLEELREQDIRGSEAARIVAHETGWPRRQVYDLWIEGS